MRPLLLDLFSGAGGAAMGYHRAGFDVVGVDVLPQPHYPFEFHQADALTFPLDGFDAIHASPPCQAFTSIRAIHKPDHPDLLTPTLELMAGLEVPWVVENVVGAPLPNPVMLCGSSFGLMVRRHRLFAANFLILSMPCRHLEQGQPLGVYGHGGGQRGDRLGKRGAQRVREWKANLAEAKVGMEIDWMDRREISQAIPPAYTEHIGAQLLASIGVM